MKLFQHFYSMKEISIMRLWNGRTNQMNSSILHYSDNEIPSIFKSVHVNTDINREQFTFLSKVVLASKKKERKLLKSYRREQYSILT